ncbi:MAG: LysR family transcriptional regulator substrate-binding protein [Pyrinomonadaceae bacterium]|nr:LysR family transcriptional regulator substrate-binding protein [Pyrinomonadaceae bacterium]
MFWRTPSYENWVLSSLSYVELTLFYSYATRLLALRNEAVTALADLARVSRGSLRIGTVESTGLYLLPRLVHDFHVQYPSIKIEVVSDHSEKLLQELKERRIDVALLAHLPEGDELESRLIMRDRLVLIVSPRHRLAGEKSIRVRELGAESIIVEETSCSLHDPVVEAFQRFQTPLNVRVESATIETIKKMVAADMGVGCVPLMCVREELARKELLAVEAEGLRDERSLWLVRRRSEAHSHTSEAFMEVIASSADALLQREQVQAEKETGDDTANLKN